MNLFKRTIFYLLAFCVFVACKTNKAVNKEVVSETNIKTPKLPENTYSFTDSSQLVLIDQVEQEKPFIVASIARTACYGKCPVYEAKVFSNGLVLYEGKKYVAREGLFEAYILEDQIKELLTQADSMQFFDLSPAYPMNGLKIYDLPSTEIYIKKADNEKTVVNNHDAPKMLRAYEVYFDQFLANLDWSKVNKEQ